MIGCFLSHPPTIHQIVYIVVQIQIEHQQAFDKLKNNPSYFFKKCLKIKTKQLGIIPLNLNDTQLHLHNEIERIRREKELCRIVVVKARQFGISTLISALSFWRAFFSIGLTSFTMADSGNSTSNIFGMIKRFYDCLPEGMPRPMLKKSNEKLIHFADNDSMIRVGTAGAPQVGRSMTNNFLHCSEVAFWKNDADILSGLFQTVPTNKESQIILESTANGQKGLFFEKAMQGMEQNSEWTTIFIPWFWHSEYSSKIEAGFKLNEEEREIKAIYKLTNAQLNWRRKKIKADFNHREYLFKQEYPANLSEAFVTTQNPLIPAIFIEKARKSQVHSYNSPIVMGVDPARGGDRTVIVIRRGREILKVVIIQYQEDDLASIDLTGRILHLIRDYKVERCFIDVALGYAIVDNLKNKGLSDIVEGVAFNQGADNPELYRNKRTEIFGRTRDWFMQEGGVRIPDNNEVARDLSILPDFTRNSNGQWVMDPKAKIKKDLGKSCDIADASALTFTDEFIELITPKSSIFNRGNAVNIVNRNRMRKK